MPWCHSSGTTSFFQTRVTILRSVRRASLYADDTLLQVSSVNALQLLLSTCELELRKLDLFINSAKAVCLRIGPRRFNNCQPSMEIV